MVEGMAWQQNLAQWFKSTNGMWLVLLIFLEIHHECFSYHYFIFSVKLSNIIVLNYRHIYILYTELMHVLVLAELLAVTF